MCMCKTIHDRLKHTYLQFKQHLDYFQHTFSAQTDTHIFLSCSLSSFQTKIAAFFMSNKRKSTIMNNAANVSKNWILTTPNKPSSTHSCSKLIQHQKSSIRVTTQARLLLQRLRPILGDRRRRSTTWRSSVVDSVVAAFLSQNVTDQQSSTAIMELMATYQNAGELPGLNSNIVIDYTRIRKAALRKEKKKYNKGKKWDRLRILHCTGNGSLDKYDSLNWEAVRVSFHEVVQKAIETRGMHDKIAGRIKAFLERMVRDHGDIDLEWLRRVPPHDAKEYLMSIDGLGLKSVECILLLALEHSAFPVDINVARVVDRLGLFSERKSDLDLSLSSARNLIHKYLLPHLSNLDIETLFELHNLLITMGKVLCTEKEPNCCACPMRNDCRYFASEVADIEDFPSPSDKMRNTQHQVFELPDEHPLLNGMDKRISHDTCPYLFAAWESDESVICEGDCPETVRGTILIPCLTAMRGKFALGGTQFQINEVFSDDESSWKPVEVSREAIHNLPTRTLYCGTSITSCLKGLQVEKIKQCFSTGILCFRGFNRKSRRPMPLSIRFHNPDKREVKLSQKN